MPIYLSRKYPLGLLRGSVIIILMVRVIALVNLWSAGMSRRWKYPLALTGLVLMLLAACEPAAHTATVSPASPTVEISPSPSAANVEPESTPTLTVETSPDVLTACHQVEQTRPLNPEMLIDLEALGLDTCYDLTFDLTSGDQYYSGSAIITFTNPGAVALNDIMLSTFPNAPVIFGGSLEITSARVDGNDLTNQLVAEDTTTVRLPLETPLEPGKTLVLDLQFSGRTPVDFESDLIYGTFHFSTEHQILLLSNAYPMLALLENGEWISTPLVAEGDPVTSLTALYWVEVRAPFDWDVTATGTELPQGGGSTLGVHQFAGGPVRDFMLAASPNFDINEAAPGSTSVTLWGMPGTGRYWKTTLEAAADSLALFDQTFGELAYDELDIVIAPLQNASGVEFPGIIILGSKLYLDEESTYLIPLVTAHEVSHQWWYAVVGNDVTEHPWLDEAMATYSGMFFEKETDPQFYDGLVSYYEERVHTYEAASGEKAVGLPVTAFAGDVRGYAIVVYNKGGLFLNALRKEIGASAFDDALHNYYEANAFKIAQPDALLDSFETACGCSLDEFYAEWGVGP